MIEKDSLKYLLPIITSYIKQAMVDQALKRVQVLTGSLFLFLNKANS